MFRAYIFLFSAVVLFSFFSCTQESGIPIFKIKLVEKTNVKKASACVVQFQQNDQGFETVAKIKPRTDTKNKPSFLLELDKKYAMGSLPIDDDWVLAACNDDASFMRSKLAFDLFRQMGSNNIAPASQHVLLEINEKSQGIFLQMEEVNAAMLNIEKTDAKSILLENPPIFNAKRPKNTLISDNYYGQKFPKRKKRDGYRTIEAFMDFVNKSNDKKFLKEIGLWVDLENLADWHLMQLLAQNFDGTPNFYFYKKNDTAPFRFMLNDMETAFGQEKGKDINKTILLQRLLRTPKSTYPKQLKRKWFLLRKKGIFSMQNIEDVIAKNEAFYKKHLSKEVKIWKKDTRFYQKDKEALVAFLKARITYLDSRLQ